MTKSKSEKIKYIDDGTVTVSVDLKACLVPDPVDRPRPLNYHERTSHIFGGEIICYNTTSRTLSVSCKRTRW